MMLHELLSLTGIFLYRSVGICMPYTFWLGGMFFSYCQKILMVGMGCKVGKNCKIEPHVDVGFNPNLTIGNDCQVNQNVTLKSAVMDDYVMVALGVVFLNRFHHFDRIDIPMAKQQSLNYRGEI